MSGISKRQARLLRRQISRMYNQNFIPLTTGDSTLGIGDILSKKKDIHPIKDGSLFPMIDMVEGKPGNHLILSDSSIGISTEVKAGNPPITEATVQFASANQMLLMIKGLRMQNVKDLAGFKQYVLKKYSEAELSSRVFIVSSVLFADQVFLQFSSQKGGKVQLAFQGKTKFAREALDTSFSVEWRKDVGYDLEFTSGGVLAYQVSRLRLNPENANESYRERILNGEPNEAILDTISLDERSALLKKGAIGLIETTDYAIVDWMSEE